MKCMGSMTSVRASRGCTASRRGVSSWPPAWGRARSCGPTAVLSHRSAAGAWGIRPDGAARWDVTVRKASAVAPDAPVRVHRHPTLRDEEVAERDGIPTTTVARTLLDLAAVVAPHHLRRAVERAD